MEKEAYYIQKVFDVFKFKVSKCVTQEPSIAFQFLIEGKFNVVEVWDVNEEGEVEIIHAYSNKEDNIETNRIKIENFQSYFAEKLGIKNYKVIPYILP